MEKDFKFIGKEINEEEILSFSKSAYKNHIKELIQKASFKYLLKEKEKHTKMDNVKYTQLKVQPYLVKSNFNKEERKLLVALRSRCHSAKANFRKLNKGNLNCSLGCDTVENQVHIFRDCQILSTNNTNDYIEYNYLFKEANKQRSHKNVFIIRTKKKCIDTQSIYLQWGWGLRK